MTMPSGNINLITDVRDNFMQDSSGNASLNSTKYRDGAGKGTGNVALTDFANLGWRQGRDLLHQPSASSVRPYNVEGGVDNITYNASRFSIAERNSLPEWRTDTFVVSYQPARTAHYISSGFKCLRPNEPHTFSWTTYYEMFDYTGAQPKHEYTVRGFSNGYKSGSSTVYKDWTSMATSLGTGIYRNGSFTFTPSPSFPYILISTRCFLWENEQVQRIIARVSEMKVTT